MSTGDRTPRAPAGLGARGGRLWREMNAEFDFSRDPQRLMLLEDACREADLIAKLQQKIDALGDDLRVKGSMNQPVAAPEVAEIRQHRAQFSALVKALALPETAETVQAAQEHQTARRSEAAKRPRLSLAR